MTARADPKQAADLALPKRTRGRPTPAAQAEYEIALAAWCEGIQEIRSSLDFDVSSRGWCYVLEEHGLTKGDFDVAQKLINACRKNGKLPLDICCEDTRRSAEHLESLDDPDPKQEAESIVNYVNSAEQHYLPHSFWVLQDTYIEVGVEKVDLKSLFSIVCKPFHIALTNFAGWGDLNGRAAMMKRFAYWETRGKRCVLLYCGDHDPGGLHIASLIRKNLMDMSNADGVDGWTPEHLIIDRFGLNADFIRRHGLTWIENLETSSGESLDDEDHNDHGKPYVQDYIREFGVRKVEANALVSRPAAGRELCRRAILKYLAADAPAKFESSLELPRQRMKAEIRRLLMRGTRS